MRFTWTSRVYHGAINCLVFNKFWQLSQIHDRHGFNELHFNWSYKARIWSNSHNSMASSVFSGFRSSLLFLMLFVASYTALAKPINNASSDPVSSIATKQCNNVYLYTAPNHEIKTILQEMKTDNSLNCKMTSTSSKRKRWLWRVRSVCLCWELNSAYFSKHLGQITTKTW